MWPFSIRQNGFDHEEFLKLVQLGNTPNGDMIQARNYYLEQESGNLTKDLLWIDSTYDYEYLDIILKGIDLGIKELTENRVASSKIRAWIKAAVKNDYRDFCRKERRKKKIVVGGEIPDTIDNEDIEPLHEYVYDTVELAFRELRQHCEEHTDLEECLCAEVLEKLGVHINIVSRNRKEIGLKAIYGEYEKVVDLLINFNSTEDAKVFNLSNTYTCYQSYIQEAKIRAERSGREMSVGDEFNKNVNGWLRQKVNRNNCVEKLVNIYNRLIKIDNK